MPADNKTTKGQSQQEDTPKMGDKISQDTPGTAQGDDLTAPIVGNQYQRQDLDVNNEPVDDDSEPEADAFDTDDNMDDTEDYDDDTDDIDAATADDLAEAEEDDDDETR